MKHRIPLLTILISTALLTGTAAAQDATPVVEQGSVEKENSVNVSPLGLMVGSYSINYERLFNGYHGVLAEVDFASASSDDSSSKSFGGNIGYRFHWRGKQDSGFVGLNVGYAQGSGEGSITSGSTMKTFNVDTSVKRITANVGRRWAWDSGLNVTFRIGAGRGDYKVTTDSDDPDAQEVVNDIDDLLTFLPVAFDGELSVGYMF